MRIAIIGAGFSGIAVAATLSKQATYPQNICLFEKTGEFALGPAYRTPYDYHLLNVRAKDMSAFADHPLHFVEWLNKQKKHSIYFSENLPVEEQFVPRRWYGEYLKDLLSGVKNLTTVTEEVVAVKPDVTDILLTTQNQQCFSFDKVVLALGNNPPSPFVAADINCIENPWDYQAVKKINKNTSVFIVGTGLSMIDAVLSLHHFNHQGKIFAASRHGLLPLPHSHTQQNFSLPPISLPISLRHLMTTLRRITADFAKEGGDWRSVIHALRESIPSLWQQLNVTDKKRFLRHAVHYWNIHRHRVHEPIAELLQKLIAKKQLEILSAQVLKMNEKKVYLQKRDGERETVYADWLINCSGPAPAKSTLHAMPLIKTLLHAGDAELDELQMGLKVDQSGALIAPKNHSSTQIYALGPLTRGMFYATTSVPEIRLQIKNLIKAII